MSSLKTYNYCFKDYRELTEEESLLVWELRNRPDIRKWMTNSDPIELADHNRFIKSLFSRPDIRYYLVKNNEGLFIGSVNISFISEHEVERGIYINPSYQGMGHAGRLLKEFYEAIHQKYSIKRIVTKVFLSNEPSNALERSLGAMPMNVESPDYNYYELNL